MSAVSAECPKACVMCRVPACVMRPVMMSVPVCVLMLAAASRVLGALPIAESFALDRAFKKSLAAS